jgi:hypothetical protein
MPFDVPATNGYAKDGYGAPVRIHSIRSRLAIRVDDRADSRKVCDSLGIKCDGNLPGQALNLTLLRAARATVLGSGNIQLTRIEMPYPQLHQQFKSVDAVMVSLL